MRRGLGCQEVACPGLGMQAGGVAVAHLAWQVTACSSTCAPSARTATCPGVGARTASARTGCVARCWRMCGNSPCVTGSWSSNGTRPGPVKPARTAATWARCSRPKRTWDRAFRYPPAEEKRAADPRRGRKAGAAASRKGSAATVGAHVRLRGRLNGHPPLAGHPAGGPGPRRRAAGAGRLGPRAEDRGRRRRSGPSANPSPPLASGSPPRRRCPPLTAPIATAHAPGPHGKLGAQGVRGGAPGLERLRGPAPCSGCRRAKRDRPIPPLWRPRRGDVLRPCSAPLGLL